MENDKTFDVNKISPCPNPTLWLFSIAMENGPFIDGLPILNNQRVTGLSYSSTTGFSHGASKAPPKIQPVDPVDSKHWQARPVRSLESW